MWYSFSASTEASAPAVLSLKPRFSEFNLASNPRRLKYGLVFVHCRGVSAHALNLLLVIKLKINNENTLYRMVRRKNTVVRQLRQWLPQNPYPAGLAAVSCLLLRLIALQCSPKDALPQILQRGSAESQRFQ